MKKTLFIAAAALVSASAFAQTATSANVVGYVKSDRPEGFKIQGTNWKDGTLQEFFGLDYRASLIPTAAQRIHTYTPGVGYESYFCYAPSVTPVNGGTEWRLMSSPTTSISNVPLKNATAIFMQTPAGGSGTNLVSGEVNMASSVTNTVVPGYQLLAYPFSTETSITNLNLLAIGTPANLIGGVVPIPTTADTLYIYDAGYKGYFIYENPTTSERSWRLDSNPTGILAPEDIPTLSQGTGFYYLSRGSENKTWVENRPYDAE